MLYPFSDPGCSLYYALILSKSFIIIYLGKDVYFSMKNVISNIIFWWPRYWQDGNFQYLLLIAAVYLLIFRRKHRGTQQILPYTAFALFLFVCPVSAFVIQKCIGAFVYWRMLWLLPTVPVIALAGAECFGSFLDRIYMNRKILNLLLTLVFIVTAGLCGKALLTSGDYVKVSNLQKVPEEVAQICNIVLEHADPEDEVLMLAADEHLASYVRVYDSSIHMPFGRRGKGALTSPQRFLHRLLNAETLRYKKISKRAQQSDCDFVIVTIADNYQPALMEQNGYVMIAEINSYGIFKRERIIEFPQKKKTSTASS